MIRSRSIRGFTLLELLVAVTVTLVIAGLMLAVTTNVLHLWRRSQASHTQATTAQQVFDLLEQDLQSAAWRRDTNRWLAADMLDSPGSLSNHGWLFGPGVMKPASGDSLRPLPVPGTGGERSLLNARFGLSGTWLRFVTTNVESGGSLPAVVAYQIARRPITGDPLATNPAAVRYSLYRSAISNTDTFAVGYDVTASGYASTPTCWVRTWSTSGAGCMCAIRTTRCCGSIPPAPATPRIRRSATARRAIPDIPRWLT
jgi:type II secretory pathway pseudopilin PulG